MTQFTSSATFGCKGEEIFTSGRHKSADGLQGITARSDETLGRVSMHLLRKFQFPVKTAMVVGYVLVVREALVLWS
ncbi:MULTISPECIES: hypothetical protein [Xanthomonas]|nr:MULTISPECIES: hypothetical protein [Xanthomonas]